jgi:hypothetical protein
MWPRSAIGSLSISRRGPPARGRPSATAVCTIFPAIGWSFGLLLGAALSHALETSLRGSICDYVCLRFWPAFNLADVALTVGALGLAFELVSAVS